MRKIKELMLKHPILGAGAIFHISFGAILAVTSMNKHKELQEHHNKGKST